MPIEHSKHEMANTMEAAGNSGLILHEATENDINQLMGWFSNEQAVCVWGGPGFRYPFSRETFHEDVRWCEMASYCLHDPDRRFIAFGQFYNRLDRINFARLIVHPDVSGGGVGRNLLGMLMSAARPLLNLSEYSLFVFRDNASALACYKSMGFEMQEYPAEMPMGDTCYYLTRPVIEQE